jgi:hypothetical protein
MVLQQSLVNAITHGPTRFRQNIECIPTEFRENDEQSMLARAHHLAIRT